MRYAVRGPRPRRPCLRAEDLHDLFSPQPCSLHMPHPSSSSLSLSFPSYQRKSSQQILMAMMTETASMLETCDVLFDSPQPYEEGKSLPSFDR